MIKIYQFDTLKPEEILNRDIRAEADVEAAVDAAARAGLREGDVIVTVGNTNVANVKEFEAAVAKLYYLFSLGLDAEKIKELMETNLCGELSR